MTDTNSETDIDTTDTDRPDRSIWPLLTATDPYALRTFLVSLGFAEGVVVPGAADGEIMHSELLWPEGGRLMVCSPAPGNPHVAAPGSASIYVVTDQPDDVHARAVAAGAEIQRELETQDYGSRGFTMVDPVGNRISFGTHGG